MYKVSQINFGWNFNTVYLTDLRDALRFPEGKPLVVTDDVVLMQWTGVQIRGIDLYEGDIVEFTDKWEWYRGTYAIKMNFASPEEKAILKANYDAEPMHRFVVQAHPFEGLNLSDYDLKQDRYQIIGNVHEHPHLLREEDEGDEEQYRLSKKLEGSL